jgi:hypothetical protein
MALSTAAPPPLAGDIKAGQIVAGDTREGIELGAYRNQFWRLAALRARDRVRVRLLGDGDQVFCPYRPGAAAYGYLEDDSPCTAGNVRVRRPASFVAAEGPGDYLIGVFGFVDGPYRLRVERIQHHVALRLRAPARIARGGLVSVRVLDGLGKPLSSHAVRVRLEAQFADGRRRLLGSGRPNAGQVRLRLSLPPDIAPYLYEDHLVTLRARAAASRTHVAAVSPAQEVRLG